MSKMLKNLLVHLEENDIVDQQEKNHVSFLFRDFKFSYLFLFPLEKSVSSNIWIFEPDFRIKKFFGFQSFLFQILKFHIFWNSKWNKKLFLKFKKLKNALRISDRAGVAAERKRLMQNLIRKSVVTKHGIEDILGIKKESDDIDSDQIKSNSEMETSWDLHLEKKNKNFK